MYEAFIFHLKDELFVWIAALLKFHGFFFFFFEVLVHVHNEEQKTRYHSIFEGNWTIKHSLFVAHKA